MKKTVRFVLATYWMVFLSNFIAAQGLPPGWEYSPTPNTHIVSIPLSCNPNINGILLNPGDYIGVFFVNNQGFFTCGGAVEWLGNQNTGLIAFGDDSFTPEKDGFSPNELMHYKVYSWATQYEYPATVTCNSGLPSSCKNFASNGLSGLATLEAMGIFATISANPSTICVGSISQLGVLPSGGSGNFTYSWSSVPPGFTSSLQNPIVNPIVNTQYFVTVNDGSMSISLSITITVNQNPIVDAGNNFTICDNQNALLNGAAINANAVNWTSEGDGSFSDPAILNPVYTPGSSDILNGSVNLTLTAAPISPCSLTANSSVNISISNSPTVFVGNDFQICENSTAQFNATASNFSSILWSSNGDGTFNNPTILNPLYSPGNNDILTGTVEISAVVSPILPCVFSGSDILVLEIQSLPQIDAGEDKFICEDESVTLNGQASLNNGLLWETTGDGTFENPTEISTIYHPGNIDVTAGDVAISLTAFSVLPCTMPVSDNMFLNIVSLPEVFAGNDASICENGVHQVTGVAHNYDEVLWTTSGDGIFGNPNLLSTTYTPGLNDLIDGTVTLELTAFPEFPCFSSSTDEKLLNIVKLPVATAGEDLGICEGENVAMAGNALNYLSIQWQTDGDGTFFDPLALNTFYFPGVNDIINTGVKLTLTAQPQFPCSLIAEDFIILEISQLPDANAGQDTTIKSGELLQLNGQALNYSTILWNTAGDGIFDNPEILNPIYTPGTLDKTNANVVLTLNAFANFPCVEGVADDLLLTIDTITSVNLIANPEKFIVFPNPNSGKFNIGNLRVFEDSFTVQIFNAHGSLMFNQRFSADFITATESLTITVPEIVDGIYLLKVFNSNNIAEGKFIVLRE